MSNAAPLQPAEVTVGCVTENNPQYLAQTLRLLQSIRWFGGALAEARVVVCAVERIDAAARRAMETLGAEIRIVPRFHPRNPSGNRLQWFEAMRDATGHFLMLDCDTIVVQDPLPHLRRGVFHAKIAPFPTVTHAVFERLFAHFGLPLPRRSHVTGYSGTPTIPYFNAGVFSIPAELAKPFLASWRKFNAALADEPSLAAPCEKHVHQAALALALAESGIPTAEAGAELNYQLNDVDQPSPAGYAEIDPVIIHYHHLANADGLLPCPFPRAQKRIDAFNERLRAEHARAMPLHHVAPTASRKQIAVLGMHRSGTSVVTRLLHAMGCYVGEARDLAAPDVFNPTGYWEHREALALDRDILGALDAKWLEPARADLSKLSPEQRETFTTRARHFAKSLDAHGTWAAKDPRMSILFPIWRDALERPVCVLVWREPVAVARSIERRDGLPLAIGLALWEEYTRAMLDATIGMPRLAINYEELVADPTRVARQLHESLVAAGAFDLRLPSDGELRELIEPALNRNGGDRNGGESDRFLDGFQCELRDALRSGEAMQWLRVPPIAAETRALLATFMDERRGSAPLRERLAETERLLAETFASRSWRLGFGLTRLLRKVVPSHQETTIDQWRRRSRRRPA
ncbi:MAG TPA: sulfotransferase [Thermoanaerobaculia bacterium]|nr:sulfotransferase [Thermoanaerobaculia bacterium]